MIKNILILYLIFGYIVSVLLAQDNTWFYQASFHYENPPYRTQYQASYFQYAKYQFSVGGVNNVIVNCRVNDMLNSNEVNLCFGSSCPVSPCTDGYAGSTSVGANCVNNNLFFIPNHAYSDGTSANEWGDIYLMNNTLFNQVNDQWDCTIQRPSDNNTLPMDTLIANGSPVDVICILNPTDDTNFICMRTIDNVILNTGAYPSGVYLITLGTPPWSTTASNNWIKSPIVLYYQGCQGVSSDIGSVMCKWGLQPCFDGTNSYSTVTTCNTGSNYLESSQFVPNSNTLQYPIGGQVVCKNHGGSTDNLCKINYSPGIGSIITVNYSSTFPWTNDISQTSYPYTEPSSPTMGTIPYMEFSSNTMSPNVMICPNYNQQTLYKLMGYGILPYLTQYNTPDSLTHQSFFGANTGGWSYYNTFNDPAGNNFIWANSGIFHPFVEYTGSSQTQGDFITQTNLENIFWTHKDPANCACSSLLETSNLPIYYDNVLKACFPLDHFCVPGHCIDPCQVVSYVEPIPESEILVTLKYFNPAGQNAPYFPDIPIGFLYSNTLGYFSSYNCNSDDNTCFSDTGEPQAAYHGFYNTKQYYSNKRTNTKTVCLPLPNTGWQGALYATCDNNANPLPWYGVGCDITCQNPNGTTLGNAACLNGGSCVFNTNTQVAFCSCAAGYDGTYCEFPTPLVLSCNDNNPISVTCNLDTSSGIPIVPNYICQSTNLQATNFTLPSPGLPYEVSTILGSYAVSFLPSNVSTAQQIWQTPLLSGNYNLCNRVINTVNGQVDIHGTLIFQCPVPYNTIAVGVLDTHNWCLLNSNYKQFTYYGESTICYQLSAPNFDYPTSSSIYYVWCHSKLPTTSPGEGLKCLLQITNTTQTSSLQSLTNTVLNGLLISQCNIGNYNGITICELWGIYCQNKGVCTTTNNPPTYAGCACPSPYFGNTCEFYVGCAVGYYGNDCQYACPQTFAFSIPECISTPIMSKYVLSAGSKTNFGSFLAYTSNNQFLMIAWSTSPYSTTGSIEIYTTNSSYPAPFNQFYSRITVTDAIGGGGLGQNLAVSANGSTIASGCYFDNTNVGAVWIFVFNGTAWNEQAKIIPTCTVGLYGCSIGLAISLSSDGNTLVISVPSENNLVGSTRVYTRNNSIWTQQANIAFRSHSVALSSNNSNFLVMAGYSELALFVRSGNSWSQQGPTIHNSDASFGFQLSLAYQTNAVAVTGSGGFIYTYIYNGTISAYQQQATMQNTGNGFSNCVAITSTGNTIAFGNAVNSIVSIYYQISNATGTFWIEGTSRTQPSGASSYGCPLLFTPDSMFLFIGTTGGNGYLEQDVLV